jgi:hypothetical protein
MRKPEMDLAILGLSALLLVPRTAAVEGMRGVSRSPVVSRIRHIPFLRSAIMSNSP